MSWRYSVFYFFYFCTVGVVVPYWGLYLQYLQFNPEQIGQLMAILVLTKIVAPNVWAAIADHLQSRSGEALGILKFATVATLLIFLLMFWVRDFWPVAMVMVGYCIFWNACLPQIEAATLNHLKDSRHQYGRIRLWGSLGFIVIVLLTGWLIDRFDPTIILTVTAISMAILFLASLSLKGTKNEESPFQDRPVSLRDVITPQVCLILLLCFLMQLSHAPFYTFFSIYLEQYGYSKTTIGILWTTGVVFEIGIFLLAARLLSRFELPHLLAFTFLIAAIRWWLVASFPESLLLMFVSQMMHAITYGLYHSVMVQIIHQFFTGRYQIRGQALYGSLTFGLGGAIGSVLSGYVWTHVGKTSLFYGVSIMMAITFVIAMLVLPRISRHQQAIP